MNSVRTGFDFGVAVRRQWWVVSIAIVLALVAGLAASAAGPVVYRAQAALDIDQLSLSRNPGLPSAEKLVRELQTNDFKKRLRNAATVDSAASGDVFKAYVVGSPASRIILTVDSADKDRADSFARVLGAQAEESAMRLGALEFDKQSALIRETEAAVASLKKPKVADDWQEADIAFKLYTVESTLITSRSQLESMQGAYQQADGTGTVTKLAAAASRLRDLLGALISGMLVGLAVAGLREWLELRRRVA